MDQEEARRALGSIDQTSQRLAAALECPPWRHAAFGAIMGLFVFGGGRSASTQGLYTAAGLLLVVALAAYDRRRWGVFVNGYRAGRTRPLAYGLLTVMLGLLVVQIYGRDQHWPQLPHTLVALAAFAIATIASAVFQRIYIGELRKGAA